MTLATLFDDLLGRHGLREPDGRRLFEYQCDESEYHILRRELRGLGEPSHLRRRVGGYGEFVGDEPIWDDEPEAARTMAGFVLYGAEWFKRYIRPPRPTWQLLFTSILWSAADYPELYPAISRGLDWWRTSAIRTPTKTLYFDTLAYQGGLGVEGLVVIEYSLTDESEHEARYMPASAPAWFQAEGIRVKKVGSNPAAARIIATFNVGGDRET